jgi:choline dehydrogenase
LPVSTISNPHPLSEAFVEGALALGHKWIDDFNAEEMVGVGYNHLTALRGQRMSAWKSFVAPIQFHPRLTVTMSALVHRVLLSKGQAVGVEYSQKGQPLKRAYARAEVVLSAGVLGSPKVLLLSGIGPSAQLDSVGVAPMVDLPAVGENLHDHLLVSIIYQAKEPVAVGANNLLEAQLYAHSSRWQGAAPNLQPVFIHIPYAADASPVPAHGYTIAAGLVAPKARGALRLASANPSDPPLTDPNVLADPGDLEAMVDAVEICRDIGASTAFAPWRKAEVAPGPAAATRKALRAFVRQAVGTYHHQVGTCQMGPAGDPKAVVGPDLRVRGVEGLRVADASIMPAITSGNTNAPAIMIGERAADLLLDGGSFARRASSDDRRSRGFHVN